MPKADSCSQPKGPQGGRKGDGSSPFNTPSRLALPLSHKPIQRGGNSAPLVVTPELEEVDGGWPFIGHSTRPKWAA